MRIRRFLYPVMISAICLLLVWSSDALAQTGKTWLERDAEIYAAAYATKDVETVHLYTHPRLMETYGDYRYRLNYLFDRMYGEVTEVGFKVIDSGIRVGDNYISFVMMDLTFEDSNNRYYKQIPLLASGYENVSGYFFIQPDDLSDGDLSYVFPGFSRSMLPEYVPSRTEAK